MTPSNVSTDIMPAQTRVTDQEIDNGWVDPADLEEVEKMINELEDFTCLIPLAHAVDEAEQDGSLVVINENLATHPVLPKFWLISLCAPTLLHTLMLK